MHCACNVRKYHAWCLVCALQDNYNELEYKDRKCKTAVSKKNLYKVARRMELTGIWPLGWN